MYFVYIIFSEVSSKYYTGQTNNIDDRLKRHNSGLSLSTKSCKPWVLIYYVEFNTRSEAMILEHKIKKRGAKRYLEDICFS
jgi:putative endonuclease